MSLLFDGQAFAPGKIVCIGRNYVEHIHELGNEIPDDMIVFNKPHTSISESLYAFQNEPLHYETELCLLVRDKKFAGIGIGFDLTKRDLQSQLSQKGLPWERSKAFYGSATFSHFIPIEGDIKDYSFTLHINDELQQQGDPSLMLYKPDVIVKELESFMPLEDNDILMTGTPKGVGQVVAGATYCARLFKRSEPVIEKTWTGK
jgi:2-keto-4-pentenoate hydratase/2-oxohepta-3-ene-1,7-dioic acid hydratase in catechol pathway